MVYSCGWLWCEEPGCPIFQSQDLTLGFAGHPHYVLSFKIQTSPQQNNGLFMVLPEGQHSEVWIQREVLWYDILCGELSSIFIKMKNGIHKPEDRQRKRWRTADVSGAAQAQLCLCAHFPSLSTFLLFLYKSPLLLQIFSSRIKWRFYSVWVCLSFLNALTAFF